MCVAFQVLCPGTKRAVHISFCLLTVPTLDCVLKQIPPINHMKRKGTRK